MAKKTRGRTGSPLFSLFLVAMMLLVIIVGISVFFSVEEIRVEGSHMYPAQEIIDASGIETDSSIFLTNGTLAAVRIKSAFPYIDEVRIRRDFPGTVVIQVTETPPRAYVAGDSSLWILSSRGKILERTDSVAGRALIELRGVTPLAPAVGDEIALGEGNTARKQALLTVLTALERLSLSAEVSWLDLTNLSNVTFFYDERITVSLGRAEGVEDKVWLLKEILENHPVGRASVDLSGYPKANYIPG